MKCKWCMGKGWVQVTKKGIVDCPNCKGTGEGKDGGDTIGGAKRPYMLGNQHARRRIGGDSEKNKTT
uniref:Uncharacterized protein n=1 Tax=viral metagenome TaxID=1070528 RepID=A0A6M3XZ32_9ZZZZ